MSNETDKDGEPDVAYDVLAQSLYADIVTARMLLIDNRPLEALNALDQSKRDNEKHFEGV